MKELIKKSNKIVEKQILIKMFLLFVLFMTLGILIPYGGDDWGNSLIKITSMTQLIDIVRGFYLTWEGRIFSRVFLCLLVPNQILWAFINSITMCLFYYILCNFFEKKYDKFIFPLIIIFILGANNVAFSQVYVWKTGNITYFFPIVFAFFLMYSRKKIFKNETLKFKKIEIILIPLTFIFSLFVENITVAIIMICFLNLILYYKKYHKIDIIMFFCLIAALISFTIMLISPGNAIRLSGETSFSNLTITQKVMSNIPNFIYYTFTSQACVISLILLIIIFSSKFRMPIKIIIYCILVVPFLTIIANYVIPFYKFHYFEILLDISRWYILIYWILFAIVAVFIVIYYTVKNKDYFPLYFAIIGLISNVSMMVTPTWGGRTAYFTAICLCICYTLILLNLYDKLLIKEIIVKILNIISFLFIVVLIVYAFVVFYFNIKRNEYIELQKKQNKKDYEIIIIPDYYAWNLNVWGSDGPFALSFKSAYGIDQNANLIMVPLKDINSIKYKEEK